MNIQICWPLLHSQGEDKWGGRWAEGEAARRWRHRDGNKSLTCDLFLTLHIAKKVYRVKVGLVWKKFNWWFKDFLLLTWSYFFPASQEVRIWNIWLKPAHVIFSLSEMFSALRSVPTLGGRAFGFSLLSKGNAFSSAPASVCCNCQLNSELCFQCFQLMSCKPLFQGVGPWKTQPCCDSSTRLAGGHRDV